MPNLTNFELAAGIEWTRARDFNLGTQTLGDLFSDIIGPVPNERFRKAVVIALEDEHHQDARVQPRIDVVTYGTVFDFAGYWAADADDRHALLLAFFIEGLTRLAEEFGWPIAAIEEAGREVAARGFVWERSSGKRKSSPNRRHKAVVWFRSDDTAARVWVRVFDKQGEVVCDLAVGETLPGVGSFYRHLGDLKWVDNRTIHLSSKNRVVHELVLPDEVTT